MAKNLFCLLGYHSRRKNHEVRHPRTHRRELVCDLRDADHITRKIHIIKRQDPHADRHLDRHGINLVSFLRYANEDPQHPAALRRDQRIRQDQPYRQVVDMERHLDREFTA